MSYSYHSIYSYYTCDSRFFCRGLVPETVLGPEEAYLNSLRRAPRFPRATELAAYAELEGVDGSALSTLRPRRGPARPQNPLLRSGNGSRPAPRGGAVALLRASLEIFLPSNGKPGREPPAASPDGSGTPLTPGPPTLPGGERAAPRHPSKY
jgi:hypothetical protein